MTKVLVMINGDGGYWEGNKGGQVVLPGRPYVLENTNGVSSRIAKGIFKHFGNLNNLAEDEKYLAIYKDCQKNKEKANETFLGIYSDKFKESESEKLEKEYISKKDKVNSAEAELAAKLLEAQTKVSETKQALEAAEVKATEAEVAVVNSTEATAEEKKALSEALAEAKKAVKNAEEAYKKAEKELEKVQK